MLAFYDWNSILIIFAGIHCYASRLRKSEIDMIALIIIFTISVLVSLNAHTATERTHTIDVEAFNYFCTQSLGKSDEAILASNGIEIPHEYIQIDPILRSMNSKFSHVTFKNKNYMVTTTSEKNKACSIVTNKMVASAVIKKITDNYKTTAYKVNENKDLKLETFEVQKAGVHQGALIAVMYSKPISVSSRGSISYVPHALLQASLKKPSENFVGK